MSVNMNNTYTGVNIRIDGHVFQGCVFENCIIEFGGEGPISLSGCTFTNCQWVFVGAAQHTLNFMHVMYHNMDEFGRKMIENTFENLKSGGVVEDSGKSPNKKV